MRKGVHPLSIHLGMAVAKTSVVQEYVSQFQFSYSQEQLIEMVRGIKLYQAHPYEQKRMATEAVYSRGSVNVLKPKASNGSTIKMNKNPILLVPSLINKSYILDLSEQRSLLRWLNQNGVPAYLFDWGDLVHEEMPEDVGISDLVEAKLCPAIKEISKIHGQKTDVLGYCMGGTLLVAAYPFVQEHIRRMVFLASPWDFHAKSSGKQNELARSVRIWSPLVLPIVKEKGVLPSAYIQALFASLGSQETVQKFIRFASMDQDSKEAKFFISVEDWLNDDVDIPGGVAEECIQGWFTDNNPAKGAWGVGDTIVNASNIKSDMLVIAAIRDRLVPFECAVALKEQSTSAKCNVLEAPTGHIGLIVGKRTVKNVWSSYAGMAEVLR